MLSALMFLATTCFVGQDLTAPTDLPDIDTLINDLAAAEGQFLRLDLEYHIASGQLEGLKTTQADGNAHIQACLSASLKQEFDSFDVSLERDFSRAAISLKYGSREKASPIYKEYHYDGTTLTWFIGVDENSRVQATIEQSLPKELTEPSAGNPRPDLLMLTPVGLRMLSDLLREASAKKKDELGQDYLQLERIGDLVSCTFQHREPAVVPGQGPGHSVSWHRFFFGKQGGVFVPVRVDELGIFGPTLIPRVAYFLEDWKSVDGLQFPHRVKAFQFVGDSVLAATADVSKISLNSNTAVPEQVEIPAGTTVTDLINNRRVRIAMRPDEIDKRIGVTMQEISKAPRTKFSIQSMFLYVNLLLVTVAFLIFITRAMRRRRAANVDGQSKGGV